MMGGAAARWAEALYRLTREEDAFRESVAALTGCAPLWDALTSPAVKPREKKAVLRRLPTLSGQPILLHFYELLADKGRLALAPDILASYHSRALREQNTAECVMRCVRAPDNAQLDSISRKLCRLHGHDAVRMIVRTDPQLLGGFTLEIDGVTYDKSARGQLRRMALQLRERGGKA